MKNREVIPGRFTGPASSPNARFGAIESEFLECDDPPSGSIVIEVDVESHDNRVYQSRDPYTGEKLSDKITIRSGNGPVIFAPIDAPVRSRWMIGREMGCRLREELHRFFDGDAEQVPGQMIVLAEDCGMIIDRLGLKESKDFWLKLRRMSAEMKSPVFVGSPTETQVWRFDKKSDYWTWAWNVRKLVDAGCGISGPRMCRPFQNVDMLPSMQKIAESNLARLQFVHPSLDYMLKRDMYLRETKLENGSEYRYNGHLTPALAGLSEHDIDFHSTFADVS